MRRAPLILILLAASATVEAQNYGQVLALARKWVADHAASGATHPSCVASGANHARGMVPDPGASAGTTKYLREDCTWQVPPAGVSGSGSSTDNAVVRWNGTGGTSVQNSGVIVDDSNNVSGVATITATTFALSGVSNTNITSGGSDAVYVFAPASGAATIRPPSGANNTLWLQGANSGGTAAGAIQVKGGSTTSGFADAAGTAALTGGDSAVSGQSGGTASIVGGAATGSATVGGDVNISGGGGTTGGSVYIQPGGSGGTRGVVLNGNSLGAANSIVVDTSGNLVFEGSSADANETTFNVANATADATWNVPALAAGTYDLPGQRSGAAAFLTGTKTLTESSDTPIVRVSAATDTGSGGTLTYAVFASDGTDQQLRAGQLYFSVVAEGTTETCATPTDVGTSHISATTGTLTCTFGCDTSPANAVDLRFNCASSLTQTTLKVDYAVQLAGPGGLTPQ